MWCEQFLRENFDYFTETRDTFYKPPIQSRFLSIVSRHPVTRRPGEHNKFTVKLEKKKK